MLKSEKPDIPLGVEASLKYELDAINNPIVPRPLLGGVGRRGKLYELSETTSFAIGSSGVGFFTFNPDVWFSDRTSVTEVTQVGPYNGAVIGMATDSTFVGTVIPTGTTPAPGETFVTWAGSKYSLPQTPGGLQWQCVGYTLRVSRKTAVLNQDGSIILYRSYNGSDVSGFDEAKLTANKNYRLISGSDVAPGQAEIILSGAPSQIDANNTSMSSLFWNARYQNLTRDSMPNRSGCVVFVTGTPSTAAAQHTFQVELVAGYMLIGRLISPKIRFGASALAADFLANARLAVVKPGRHTTPEETRRGADAVIKHQSAKEDGLLDMGFKHFKNVGKAMLRDSSKIGAILETLL